RTSPVSWYTVNEVETGDTENGDVLNAAILVACAGKFGEAPGGELSTSTIRALEFNYDIGPTYCGSEPDGTLCDDATNGICYAGECVACDEPVTCNDPSIWYGDCQRFAYSACITGGGSEVIYTLECDRGPITGDSCNLPSGMPGICVGFEGYYGGSCIEQVKAADAFGMFYISENAFFNGLDTNSPTSVQNQFGSVKVKEQSRDMLKSITTPNNNHYRAEYSVDNWKTSSVDSMIGESPFPSFYQDTNYGGGIKVDELWKCNSFNDCTVNRFDYKGGVGRLENTTSGTLSLVPLKPRGYESSEDPERDLRRNSHKSTDYVSGGVLYNKVTTTFGAHKYIGEYPDMLPGKIVNYYTTVDTNENNLPGIVEGNLLNDFVGVGLNANLACEWGSELYMDERCKDLIRKRYDIGETIELLTAALTKFPECNENADLTSSSTHSSFHACRVEFKDIPNNKPGKSWLIFPTDDHPDGFIPPLLSLDPFKPKIVSENADQTVKLVYDFDRNDEDLMQQFLESSRAIQGGDKRWTRGLNFRQEIITPEHNKTVVAYPIVNELINWTFGNVILNSDPQTPSNEALIFPNRDLNTISAGRILTKSITLSVYPNISESESYEVKKIYEDYNELDPVPQTTKTILKNLDGDVQILKKMYHLTDDETNPLYSIFSYDNLHLTGKVSGTEKYYGNSLISKTIMNYKAIKPDFYKLANTTEKLNDGFYTEANMYYDNNGNVIRIERSSGFSDYFAYDSRGRKIKEWDSEIGSQSNPKIEYFYNDRGILFKEVYLEGHVVEYDYDAFGRKINETLTYPTYSSNYPWKTINVEYSYEKLDTAKVFLKKKTFVNVDGQNKGVQIDFFDSVGNVIQSQTKIKDDTYLIKAYDFDMFGNIVKSYYPFRLESSGNFVPKNDYESQPWQVKNHYENSIAPRLTSIEYPDGGTLTYDYKAENGLPVILVTDQNGNAKKLIFDTMGNVLKLYEGESFEIITEFIYDSEGRLTKIIDPLGRDFISNKYDDYGLIETVGLNSEVSENYYDSEKRLLSKIDSQINVTYSYDARDRISSVLYDYTS
ncbi:hypothetical protein K9L97_02490, partial [Candidatus Woesearchaeota archaeon]|nr:hypothetical protein [Candidatus Woesearchaeota archaeon]